MPSKVTFLFGYATQPIGQGAQRTGGWSETWYNPYAPSMSGILQRARRWVNLRCGMLPATTKIVGFRISGINPGDASQVFTAAQPGIQSAATDIPQAAINVRMPVQGATNQRTMQIRGIPDDWVKGGSIFWNQPLRDSFAAFLANLQVDNWAIQGRVQTQVQYPLISIAENGSYVSAVDLPFVEGNFAQVLRAISTTELRRRGGFYQVLTVTSPRAGILANWNWPACLKGVIRGADKAIYPVLTGGLDEGAYSASTRKVGRAFFQYRGRRSRR